ncbi:hypothetical protein [Desulfitibacter alkalitolerans]|uniref:hypothetical protein n=1 Tax=Desulfitibacter alkalitolerans TaxID=264641 RepID=UPI0004811340|nr:hypothetical protein [Desulfitibacter alkalitolerans]
MLKKIKILTAVFIVGFLFSSGLSSALASAIVGSGTWNDFTVLGKKYSQISNVYLVLDNNDVYAHHYIYTTSHAAVGDMGARSRLYDGSGNIVRTTAWAYNAESGTNKVAQAYTSLMTGVQGQSYYSKGQGRAYNGNGYTQHEANSSRMVTVP